MKARKAAAIADLTARIDTLEHLWRQEHHVHSWRYQKRVYESGGAFWSWDCDNPDCPTPSSGTNHRGGIVDHFPADLR